MRRTSLLPAVLLIFGASLHAGAQTASIVGVVHVFGDSVGRLRDVDVSLDPTDRTTRTDTLGRFRFSGLRSGTYRLRVRRVGFDATLMTVVASANVETAVNIAMKSFTQAMATMTIAGRRVDYPVRLAEAYTRVRRSTGSFFTREQIDSLFPLDVNALLMRTPGVRVLGNNQFEFARCRHDGHIQVWVEGVRRTRYSTGGVFNIDAGTALKDIPPSSIQLMEVYGGVARLPGEYLDDACAVILSWLK